MESSKKLNWFTNADMGKIIITGEGVRWWEFGGYEANSNCFIRGLLFNFVQFLFRAPGYYLQRRFSLEYLPSSETKPHSPNTHVHS